MDSESSAERILHEARAHAAGVERDAYLARACGGDAALRTHVEALLRGDSEAMASSGSRELPADDARSVHVALAGAASSADPDFDPDATIPDDRHRSGEAGSAPVAASASASAPASASASAAAADPAGDDDIGLAMPTAADLQRAASKGETAAFTEQPGQMIGRYKLLQKIGEGGFGSVWMAEQREPVKRRVALKIVKLGMDTHQVIARFEAERQALAMMDHPNIARVLDAAATNAGRPFFVMELVKGVPITEYCDTEKLDTPARLELFIQVCHAIQHAHQKGVIHRDIKPSNVLVTLHDGVPVPKVIDFGIAKATGAELTEKTLFTEQGRMIGTPAYMSPEQAEMSGLDIDTRTDIYSLGVLLYELLTGTTPFDGAQLRRAGYVEMLRIIREEEPHRPSTRLSALAQKPPAVQAHPTAGGETTKASRVARARRSDPRSLVRSLRGDLDWIALKCLEKDRTRRYETAAALAEDVQHYLDDEPVEARPPSATYRLSKLARRHRGVFTGVAVLAVALLVGLGGLVYGFVAVSAQRDKTMTALQDVVKTRDGLHAALDFLSDILAAADPNATRGREVTVRELLIEAEGRIRAGELSGQPVVEARLRCTLGQTFGALGDYDRALDHLTASVAAFEAGNATQTPEWARAMIDLGLLRLMRGEYDKAGDYLHAVIAAGSQPSEAPVSDMAMAIPRSYVVEAEAGLAETSYLQGRYDDAVAAFRRLIEADADGVAADLRASIHQDLGAALQAKGQYDEALLELDQALTEFARLKGEINTDYASVLNDIANTNEAAGRLDKAEAAHRRGLDIRIKLVGEDHPSVGTTLNNLALVLVRQGKAAEAEEMFRRSLANRRATLPPSHSGIAITLNNYALALRDLGRPEEAEALYAEAEDIARKTLPPEHLFRIVLRGNRAENWIALDRAAEAEPVLLDCFKKLADTRPVEDRRTQRVVKALVTLYEATGQAERAAGWREKLVDRAPE